jgi:hypothetical protein
METSDPKYKHKPSEKHTLEEVLKSLQDLIRNDLAESASGTAKPGSTPAASHQHEGASSGTADAKPRRDNTSSLREDFAPVALGSGPVNLDAVMRSLKDLIGNELNVGDTPPPAPAEPPSASTHEEYLATEEKIEEYIPDDLGRLDNVPDLGNASAPESGPATSPQPESLAPDEIIEETLPQGFSPLDEELTLEELAEAAPPPPALSEAPDLPGEISIEESLPEGFIPLDDELTLEKPVAMAPPEPALSEMPDLPGEISPELLIEPEVTPPPLVPEASLALDDAIVPGTQQEMFLEEPPLIELRVPPRDSQITPATEPAPAPETPAAPVVNAPASEEDKNNSGQALPAIEVEENFDTGNYLDTVEPPAETPSPASEEFITLDVEISGTSETTPPAVETSPATPTDASPAPEPPAAPVEKKITLEIASESELDNAQNRSSVDFDTLGLEPAQPEQAPAPETELPVIVVEPDLSPAPEPGTPKVTEAAPVVETGVETAPGAKSPAAPVDSATKDASAASNLEGIPVLNEVVAPPAGSIPAAKLAAAPPLPAPDRARDLVVRAVAKLNVEMRKTGGAGLDTKTILRLQQLIRQELEKSGEK